jgi:hypothetical protein
MALVSLVDSVLLMNFPDFREPKHPPIKKPVTFSVTYPVVIMISIFLCNAGLARH